MLWDASGFTICFNLNRFATMRWVLDFVVLLFVHLFT